MAKNETKRVNKIREGDVFSIPISNGNYGVGQVIKKEHPHRNVNAWLVLFDKEFNQVEIMDINNINISEIAILSIMPLNLVLIRHKDWPIIDNRNPVKVGIPMFQGFNAEKNKYFIYDIQHTMVRYHNNPVADSMVGEFASGPIYFTDLCELKWGDSDMVQPHITRGKWTWDTYYYHWPINCPTEDDMVINAHLYQYRPIRT